MSVSAEIASKYLGCYYDEEPDRRFQGDFKDFPNTLTHQTCIDYCKNKGYPFAGLQYRYESGSLDALVFHSPNCFVLNTFTILVVCFELTHNLQFNVAKERNNRNHQLIISLSRVIC